MTLEDMSNAISLPALEDGHLPLNGPDGKDQSGPEAVPVSRFRSREKEKAMPTNAISGPLFNNSSPSASLQWSLESRLRQKLEGSGCPLYDLTWSQWDMPAGAQICRQRASARRISDKDFSGWPTPVSHPANGTPEDFLRRKRESVARGSQMGIVLSNLQMVAKTVEVPLAGWPSPLANKLSPQQREDFTPNLANVAQRAGPLAASDTNVDTESDATTSADSPQDAVAGAVANSPTNAQDNGENALLSGWTSPRASDDNQSRRMDVSMEREINRPNRGASLAIDAYMAGKTLNGSPAPMGRRGQLNPEFTRWLMGYPEEWASCAPTATR